MKWLIFIQKHRQVLIPDNTGSDKLNQPVADSYFATFFTELPKKEKKKTN